MIDFACKKFDLHEVIKCSLGLTKSEFILLTFLIKNNSKRFSAKELNSNIEQDLSTIQRSLKRLYEKELLIRSQANLSPGGYLFSYRIKDKKEIKEKILSIVKNWENQVEKELNSWSR
jgi:predicted transcriptional regulator